MRGHFLNSPSNFPKIQEEMIRFNNLMRSHLDAISWALKAVQPLDEHHRGLLKFSALSGFDFYDALRGRVLDLIQSPLADQKWLGLDDCLRGISLENSISPNYVNLARDGWTVGGRRAT